MSETTEETPAELPAYKSALLAVGARRELVPVAGFSSTLAKLR